MAGLSQLLGDKLPLVLPTLAVLLLAYLLPKLLLQRDPLAHIPDVGKELGDDEKRRQAYLFSATNLYREGYQKVIFPSLPLLHWHTVSLSSCILV